MPNVESVLLDEDKLYGMQDFGQIFLFLGGKDDDKYVHHLPAGFSIQSVTFDGPSTWWSFGVLMGKATLEQSAKPGDTGTVTFVVHWWHNGWATVKYKLKVVVEGPYKLGVPVTVSISPPSSSTTPGSLVRFAATVKGTSNASVTWQASSGAVSAQGDWIAPGPGVYKITATSVADPTVSATATITVADWAKNGLGSVLLAAARADGEFKASSSFTGIYPPDAKITALTVDAPQQFADNYGNPPSFQLLHVDSLASHQHVIEDEAWYTVFNAAFANGSWSGSFYDAYYRNGDDARPASVTVLFTWVRP
jgi:hypothetical protein